MISLTEAFKYAASEVERGSFGTAEQVYCQIISQVEDNPNAYLALGAIYALLNHPGRAITFLKRGLELAPKNHEAMANLSAVYRQVGKKDKAFKWNRKALDLAPSSANILSNMAGLFVNAGEPEKAVHWATKALAVDPEHAQAGNHRALGLLEQGKYVEGWAQYDARLRLPNFHRRGFTCPMWDGSPVKRLAIHGEQGLGDEILFLTCLDQLRDRFEEVEIEVASRLVPLMQSSFPWAKVYGRDGEQPFEPDAYIPMGSLPRLCWPVVPNTYLKPSTTLAKGGIGLSWHGGTAQSHQELRNAPVESWRTFLDLGDCKSLQYGPREEEAAKLGIPHDSAAIADLDSLAALVQSCDLVITVCNTTVHLAGALGVPCVVLVPSAPAWRYGMTGDRMVWYDSPRMVRQGEGEAWASVFERAKSIAKEMIGADNRNLSRIEPRAA